jgi:hypothetical protein
MILLSDPAGLMMCTLWVCYAPPHLLRSEVGGRDIPDNNTLVREGWNQSCAHRISDANSNIWMVYWILLVTNTSSSPEKVHASHTLMTFEMLSIATMYPVIAEMALPPPTLITWWTFNTATRHTSLWRTLFTRSTHSSRKAERSYLVPQWQDRCFVRFECHCDMQHCGFAIHHGIVFGWMVW